MVEASKFWFDKACSGCACHELIHPWTYKCSDATGMMLASCIKGAYKFYAMVYLKRRGTAATGACSRAHRSIRGESQRCASTLRMLRLFFSQFSYYNTVLLPCTISGLAVYFEPPYRRVLVVNLFVNLVFEYWLRTLEMKGWLRRSPGRETLIFMFGSAVFFYLMRKERENVKRTPLFWFFTPPRVSKQVGEPVTGIEGRSPACPHSGNCVNYVLKLIVCLLCRAHGRDSALYALPAGFLAGAAFRAAPSTPIALAPLTSTLQILGSWGYQKGLIPEKLPLVEILYCLCQERTRSSVVS
ncbi:hypothetical protein MSG28_007942 [Choristoneura fumiferana]|uniref:Uncharacterized protein n=1 Tax=Choristoneura fumiferana TaxID=7141 RepID=A0ACC0J9A7_CHOFU|nr:hypothetical protein MSG28_007942 [Choristoneura fumiferana]